MQNKVDSSFILIKHLLPMSELNNLLFILIKSTLKVFSATATLFLLIFVDINYFIIGC